METGNSQGIYRVWKTRGTACSLQTLNTQIVANTQPCPVNSTAHYVGGHGHAACLQTSLMLKQNQIKHVLLPEKISHNFIERTKATIGLAPITELHQYNRPSRPQRERAQYRWHTRPLSNLPPSPAVCRLVGPSCVASHETMQCRGHASYGCNASHFHAWTLPVQHRDRSVNFCQRSTAAGNKSNSTFTPQSANIGTATK